MPNWILTHCGPRHAVRLWPDGNYRSSFFESAQCNANSHSAKWSTSCPWKALYVTLLNNVNFASRRCNPSSHYRGRPPGIPFVCKSRHLSVTLHRGDSRADSICDKRRKRACVSGQTYFCALMLLISVIVTYLLSARIFYLLFPMQKVTNALVQSSLLSSSTH